MNRPEYLHSAAVSHFSWLLYWSGTSSNTYVFSQIALSQMSLALNSIQCHRRFSTALSNISLFLFWSEADGNAKQFFNAATARIFLILHLSGRSATVTSSFCTYLYYKPPESCFHQDYMLMFHVLSLQLFTNLAALAFIKIIHMLICKVLSLHSFTNLPALLFIKIMFQCLSFFLYSFFHTSFMPHTDQELFSMTIGSLKELL